MVKSCKTALSLAIVMMVGFVEFVWGGEGRSRTGKSGQGLRFRGPLGLPLARPLHAKCWRGRRDLNPRASAGELLKGFPALAAGLTVRWFKPDSPTSPLVQRCAT